MATNAGRASPGFELVWWHCALWVCCLSAAHSYTASWKPGKSTAAILMLSGWKPNRGDMATRGRVILGLTAGGGLGTVAGLIGRGGGSFVVPLLYIVVLEAKMAAATSAFVVTCSGLSSFVSHLATAAQPQWGVWIATMLAVLLGSQLGSRLMA